MCYNARIFMDRKDPDPGKRPEADKKNPPDAGHLKSRRKYRLLTDKEEKHRSFRVAREHFIKKYFDAAQDPRARRWSLPYLWDRVVASVGFFLLVFLLIWFFRHFDFLMKQFSSMLEKLSVYF